MINIYERTTNRIPGVSSLFVKFNYNPLIVDELKLLESSFYDANTKEWEIPLTELSKFIDRVCKLDTIHIELLPEVQSVMEQYQLQEYQTTPFDYQLEGIQYGLNHDKWLLLDCPGLGKTLQLTYLAQELKSRYNIQHCLVICGINTLKMNWKNEITKHSALSCRILGERINRKGKLVVDGVKERLAQLKAPIEEFFVITNVETLRSDEIVKALNSSKYNKFDMIVIDEVHKCKSPTSQQSSNLLKLTKAKYKIGATGTLLLNNPLDAYVPLKWIGVENATYGNFKNYYCSFGGPFNNTLLGYKNVTILKNQLKTCSLRRTKDILNLPPKVVIHEYVEMNPDQEIFYNNIKEGVALEVVNKVTLSTANLLSLVTRLRQATACPTILTTENISSSKQERAIDLAEQIIASGEKVVIFSTFKETVNQLFGKLADYGIVVATGDQTEEQIEQAKFAFMNDPEIKIFLGTWQKCGTGLTLTSASYMIFIDTPWTAADFDQCCDRIHRIGTSKSVTIYNLVVRETIDERVLELVNDKAAITDYIVDDKITESGISSLRKYIQEFI